VEASAANHGPGGAMEDGGHVRTMWPAAAWWNPSLLGRPLYSLDRDNGLWAQLLQNGGTPVAQIARGAREGPPGRFRWGVRSVYSKYTKVYYKYSVYIC
jgi:hypothetical protein